MNTIIRIGVIAVGTSLGACSAPISSTSLDSEGVNSTNSSQNSLHMRRSPDGVMTVSTNSKDSYSMMHSSSDGIQVVSPGSSHLVVLDLESM
ncbi:MAG: hypothetical protein AAGK04_09935, partial [Planctomycetota bacterium]